MSLTAAAAILAALSFASTVFAPVACALFIIALVWPMQRRLQTHLPRLVALAIVVVAISAAFMIFASLVAWSFGRVGRWLVADAAHLQRLYGQAAEWLEAHGVGVATLRAEHFNVGWLLRSLQEVTGRVNTTVAFLLVVLVYVILGLLEVDEPDAGSWPCETQRLRASCSRAPPRLLPSSAGICSFARK